VTGAPCSDGRHGEAHNAPGEGAQEEARCIPAEMGRRSRTAFPWRWFAEVQEQAQDVPAETRDGARSRGDEQGLANGAPAEDAQASQRHFPRRRGARGCVARLWHRGVSGRVSAETPANRLEARGRVCTKAHVCTGGSRRRRQLDFEAPDYRQPTGFRGDASSPAARRPISTEMSNVTCREWREFPRRWSCSGRTSGGSPVGEAWMLQSWYGVGDVALKDGRVTGGADHCST
jgi:hypothetical protein